MIVCPDCGHQNIPGADTCEKCEQSLSPLSDPQPHNAIERQIAEDRIEVLRPKPAVTVSAGAKVGDVLKLMVERHIGCVLVVEDDAVAGIFSERDVLMRLGADGSQAADMPISEFMTSPPETLAGQDKIAYALHKMDLGGYRHVPIVDDGGPPRMISIRDVLRYMTERLSGK